MSNKVKDFVVDVVKDPMSRGMLVGGGLMIAFYSCVLNHEYKKFRQEKTQKYMDGYNAACRIGNMIHDLDHDIIKDLSKRNDKLKLEIEELKKEKKS